MNARWAPATIRIPEQYYWIQLPTAIIFGCFAWYGPLAPDVLGAIAAIIAVSYGVLRTRQMGRRQTKGGVIVLLAKECALGLLLFLLTFCATLGLGHIAPTITK